MSRTTLTSLKTLRARSQGAPVGVTGRARVRTAVWSWVRVMIRISTVNANQNFRYSSHQLSLLVETFCE